MTDIVEALLESAKITTTEEMKMIRKIFGLSLLCVLTACGRASNKNEDQTPSKTPPANDGPLVGENPTGKVGTAGSDAWFGIVTKCLVDAEEEKVPGNNGSTGITLNEKVICSPLMSDNDRKALETKLAAWSKEHCTNVVPVRNGTPQGFSNCSLKPYGGVKMYSNNKGVVDPPRDSDCSGGRGKNFGTLNCSRF